MYEVSKFTFNASSLEFQQPALGTNHENITPRAWHQIIMVFRVERPLTSSVA